VPVIGEDRRLLGLLTRRDIIAAYSRRLAELRG
jgi:CBS domain-containing protein